MQQQISGLFILLLVWCFFFLFSFSQRGSPQRGEVSGSTEHVQSTSDGIMPKKGLRLTQTSNVRMSIGSNKRNTFTKISGIEITVRPDTITSSERFVIMEYGVDGRDNFRLDGDVEYLGSYAFFAPVAAGDDVKFFVQVPQNFWQDTIEPLKTFEIEIRLEPISPDKNLKKTVLTVLSAELVK